MSATSPKRAITTLLFDFGGTLDSAGRHWSTLFADAAAECGVEILQPTFDHAFLAADRALNAEPGTGALGLYDHVLRQTELLLTELKQADPGLAMRVAARFVEDALVHLDRSRLLLARERPARRIGVISNFTPNLPRIVRDVGLAPYVDVLACSDILGLRKPGHDIFHWTLTTLGVAARDCAMIGDSLTNDVMPAKTLGMTTVWLRGDRVFGKGDPSAADHTVSTLAEALAALS